MFEWEVDRVEMTKSNISRAGIWILTNAFYVSNFWYMVHHLELTWPNHSEKWPAGIWSCFSSSLHFKSEKHEDPQSPTKTQTLMNSVLSETPTVSENQKNRRFTHTYHKLLVYIKHNHRIILVEKKNENKEWKKWNLGR